MFACLFAASLIDQDTAHGLGGGGKEMAAAVPLPRCVTLHQPQIRLMHQRRRLQRLPWFLLRSFAAANSRNASYTSGNNSAAACGSPCSMEDRMRVTSFMGSAPHGEKITRHNP